MVVGKRVSGAAGVRSRGWGGAGGGPGGRDARGGGAGGAAAERRVPVFPLRCKLLHNERGRERGALRRPETGLNFLF